MGNGAAVHTKSSDRRSANQSTSPETASPCREDVRAEDILPEPDPNAVEQSDKFGPVMYGGKPVISDAVKELPEAGRPEPGARPEAVPPLEPTWNNSPQRSEEVREGDYDYCPNPVVVERTDRKTGEVDTVEIDCDRKWCPYCGPKMKRQYVAHFTERFSGLPSLKFVTLTLDPKAFGDGVEIDPSDFAESRKYLLHIWERRFVKRVKRRSDGEVTYVASVERHESGQAHLHVVMSCTLNEAQLREQWFESGGGVVMEATGILSDSHVARKVGYVMKYCFQESFEKGDGRNAVFCSEGIGYHSEQSREDRREHINGKSEGDIMDDWSPDRYEFDPPDGGGHTDNGDRVTEEEKARFDRIADEARSTTYVDWEGESAPREGTRIRYDRETGETEREPVREVLTGSGGTKIVGRG